MGRSVPTVAYGLDRRPMEHVRASDVGVPADPVGSFVRWTAGWRRLRPEAC